MLHRSTKECHLSKWSTINSMFHRSIKEYYLTKRFTINSCYKDLLKISFMFSLSLKAISALTILDHYH